MRIRGKLFWWQPKVSLANVAQAVFLSPVPGVQIVESGEGKKKEKMRGGGAGERESERSRGKEEGRTRSLIPLPLKALSPPPPRCFFSLAHLCLYVLP